MNLQRLIFVLLHMDFEFEKREDALISLKSNISLPRSIVLRLIWQ